MHLNGKSCSKLANGLNFYDLKKTLTGVILSDPALGLHTSILPFYINKQNYRIFFTL